MKITRYKRVQRYLSFYRNHFEFRPPYQILLDATFCQAALQNKVNIKEQMEKYLNEECKLLTTVCVVNEAEKLGRSIYGAMLIIKQFPIHKCGHERNPIAANECLYSLLSRQGKQEHYMLATQDKELTTQIRELAHVPIIFIKMNTIIMEKPADSAKEQVLQSQERFFDVDSHQFRTLKKLKKLEGINEKNNVPRMKKRKGPKGPNPLSCKKKKKEKNIDPDSSSQNPPNDGTSSSNKRKRKRKKNVPRHITRMLYKMEKDLNINNIKDPKS